MPKNIEPRINLHAFNCPHCGALADQHWYSSFVKTINNKGLPRIPNEEVLEKINELIRESDDQDKAEEWSDFKQKTRRQMTGALFLSPEKDAYYCKTSIQNLFVSKCYCCKEISIWRHNRLLFPVTNNEFIPNEDLTQDIKNDFLEAASIINLSPRGAAALLRLCVQKLCIQLGEKGENINNDIASLVKKGLNKKLQQALDIVRVTGNDAVHPGKINFNDDSSTASSLFKLVNTIADEMISQPNHVDALFEKLPETKKAAIANRDNK